MNAEERRARALVGARSAGVCERCGKAPATEWHHRRNRSQGGKWTAGNGLHLCSPCHKYITEHPAESYRNGWAVRGGTAREPFQVPAYLFRDPWSPSWCWLHDEGDVTSVRQEEIYEFAEGRG